MSAVETASPNARPGTAPDPAPNAPPGAAPSAGADAAPHYDPKAPPPIVHGTPVELADGVYVIPDGRVPLVPNVGVIVGDRAALVIETGLGPRSGKITHDVARQLAGDRPLLLTLTHFHPEHGFGAAAFRGATLIYNRAQHDEFRQKASGYRDMFSQFGGAVAAELADVTFVDPHVVYDGAADLDLGGKLVQLRTWGPAHTRGDQTVFLPAERILFGGDLVETRFYPILPFFPPYDVDVDPGNWMTVMQELQRLGPRVVVPGHGELADTALLATTYEYLQFLRSETKRLAAEGKDAGAIIAAITPTLHARYPDWDASEPWRIATGVQACLAH